MGCHTWFYRKDNRTIEEARQIFIDLCKQSIIQWDEMLDNQNDECRLAYKWTDQDCINQINILKRWIRIVEKGLCNVAVMNKQPEHCIYIQEKGFFITDDSMTHDLFRIGHYPKNKLFSFKETMKFIEDNKNKVYSLHSIGDSDHVQLLMEFWANYPDGMILFG